MWPVRARRRTDPVWVSGSRTKYLKFRIPNRLFPFPVPDALTRNVYMYTETQEEENEPR